jgi:hypothetical protein
MSHTDAVSGTGKNMLARLRGSACACLLAAALGCRSACLRAQKTGENPIMQIIWTLIVILFVLWLVGLFVHIGGSLIHILLVIAVILLIFNLLTGRGAKV